MLKMLVKIKKRKEKKRSHGLTPLFFADPAEVWNHELNVGGRRHSCLKKKEKSHGLTPLVFAGPAEVWNNEYELNVGGGRHSRLSVFLIVV